MISHHSILHQFARQVLSAMPASENMNRYGFLFVLLSFTFFPAKAQEKRPANLSQIHLGIGYMPVLHFSPETFDYIPSQMLRLTIGSNYMSGYLKANLQYTHIVSDNQRPDCNMFDNSLSYLYYVRLYKGLSIYAGAQIGLNTIQFEDDSALVEDRKRETEVSSGLELGIEMRVIPKLGISGSYKLQRIFATPRNNLSMIDIGLVYYFNSSEKLKQWLE